MELSVRSKRMLMIGGAAIAVAAGAWLLYRRRKAGLKRLDTLEDDSMLDTFDFSRGQTVLVRDVVSCETWIDRMLADGAMVVGLDAEWRPATHRGERNKVAVLQLATEKICLVIQMNRMEFIPDKLKDLLRDPSIIKTGVGISGDIKKLVGDHMLDVRGAVDLQPLAVRCGYTRISTGLRSLVANILQRRIPKLRSLQLSDWDQDELTAEQIEYAAADAWACVAVFHELFRRDKESGKVATLMTRANRPTRKQRAAAQPGGASPASPGTPVSAGAGATTSDAFAEAAAELDEAGKHRAEIRAWCLEYIDRKVFSYQQVQQRRENKANGVKGARRVKAPKNAPSRQSPLYENCRILAPNGQVLCTCSRKKINWYLDRQLADMITEEPPTIRLKFEPKGAGHMGDEFYLSVKENRCVACGETNNTLRHHVVPHFYRKHFPEFLKSHSSHDIVLLCQPCHGRVVQADENLKRIIAAEVGIEAYSQGTNVTRNVPLHKVRMNARALRGAMAEGESCRMPAERITHLRTSIAEHLGKSEAALTDDDIRAVSDMNTDVNKQGDEAPICKQVVERIDDLQGFIRRWRQHFLDVAQPRFLPAYWDVNHVDHPFDPTRGDPALASVPPLGAGAGAQPGNAGGATTDGGEEEGDEEGDDEEEDEQ